MQGSFHGPLLSCKFTCTMYIYLYTSIHVYYLGKYVPVYLMNICILHVHVIRFHCRMMLMLSCGEKWPGKGYCVH